MEFKQTQDEMADFEQEKRNVAEQEERLRQSIEANRATLNKVVEVRSSAEASVTQVTDRAAEIRASRDSRMRASQENPMREAEEGKSAASSGQKLSQQQPQPPVLKPTSTATPHGIQ